MATSDKEIVSTLEVALAEKVGSDRFQLWFGANTRFSFAGDALVVEVPNRFFQDWLRNNFRREIEQAALETIGRAVSVSFQLGPAANAPRPATAVSSPSIALASQPAEKIASPAATPATDKASAPRRKFAALDKFVVGPANQMAHVSAKRAVDNLGSASPLLLHGPTGVGKTHLLEGIWTAARRKNSAIHAVYLSAEQFTTYFLSALHGSGLPNFRRKYRGVELLIVDDVQFFAGKRATLVELLHTIDTLLREGKQLVFAADRPPEQLTELGPELVARLQGGLVCAVEPPEYETRLGVARQMATAMGVPIPDDVLAYLAANINTHARAISGAIKRLQAYSEARQQPITLALAEETLADTIRAHARSITLTDIESAVCEAFGLEPKSLQAAGKGKRVNQPRMLAMWLARKHTRAALSEIGHYFGRRSHSTVISAQKRVNTWMADSSPVELAQRPCRVEEAIRRVEDQLRAG